ncbi:MAG: glycosyltransferase family 2 protein [Anaerofustis sp.]
MKEFLYQSIVFANDFSLIYIVLVNVVYFLQLTGAGFNLMSYIKSLRFSDYRRYIESENMIPISLLVPAYNEAETILDNVKNLLSLNFPEYEVIVINDGSTDKTLQLLIDEFEMISFPEPYKRSVHSAEIRKIYRTPKNPRLIVVDKVNGGKADALNAGINLSNYPVFVSIDADSILEKESLSKIIMPFVSDHEVVAVGGIVRIASGCTIKNGELVDIGLSRKPLIMLQTVEYLRAFLTGRIGFASIDILMIISGAFGAFSKNAAIDVGGYTVGCIGEDVELVVKIHRSMLEKKQKYKVKFLADPVCWTQPPDQLSDLKKQRKRWQIGLMNTLFMHKKMLFNPKYGRIGLLGLPYFWIFEFIGPLIEVFGFILVPVSFFLGVVNIEFLLSFFALAVLGGCILSVGALLLEENTFKKYPSASQVSRLLLYAVIDNFGYRHLNTIYKVMAIFSYKKSKHTWGQITRKRLET